MRKLFLLQGLPGSGKSTLLQQAGLLDYVLSSDSIRLMLSAPRLRADGSSEISQRQGGFIWKLLFEILEQRMVVGSTTFVDATHLTLASLKAYKNLAMAYGYKVYLISLAAVPFALCCERNLRREEFRRVPADIMLQFKEQLESFQKPDWLELISPAAIPSVLLPPLIDIGSLGLKELHFVGDVRGYSQQLQKFIADVDRENSLFIFTGDILGEGTENAQLLQIITDLRRSAAVMCCEGFMERQLRLHLAGQKVRSGIFNEGVKPQLLAADIPREALVSFLSELKELLLLQLNSLRLWVTHGGLPAPIAPEHLGLICSDDLILGAGNLDTAVDQAFSAAAAAECWQIHGHRNVQGHAIEATPPSYNLCGSPGELRTLSLTIASRELRTHSFADATSSPIASVPKPPAT